MNITTLIRPNIQALVPYKSARSQYCGQSSILLDANENPFGDGHTNRYPDPYQSELRACVAQRAQCEPENVLLGNGSDELIDLLMRVFCVPNQDAIVICPPTFGMYHVAAQINAIETIKVPLTKDYQIDAQNVGKQSAKILFLPNPNAPTGNLFAPQDIETILESFSGIVVIDEAYIDFAQTPSWSQKIQQYPHLVVLQTFSKYWGLAGCRVGMMFANAQIINAVSKIKAPYNVNVLSAQKALQAMKNEPTIKANAQILIQERARVAQSLQEYAFIKNVSASQTNYLWVEAPKAQNIAKELKKQNIIIRTYTSDPNFMRISIGTPDQNTLLLDALKTISL